MGKTTSSLPLRRSARVNIGCPVRISGMLANNVPFAEDAQIVTLSKFGAKIEDSYSATGGNAGEGTAPAGKNPGSSKLFGLAGRARRAQVRWESSTRRRLPASWELISPT